MSLPAAVIRGETYARIALALGDERHPVSLRLAAFTAWREALDATQGDAKAARALVDVTFDRLAAAHRAAETVVGA